MGPTTAHLFAPGRIGTVETKNRIVMPAMITGLADRDGFVSERMIAWYEARAIGGAGLVTVEMALTESPRFYCRARLGIYHDRFVAGLRLLTCRLHTAGADCAVQLGDSLGIMSSDDDPKPQKCLKTRNRLSPIAEGIVSLQAIDAQRMAEIIAAHVDAARRAKQARFDVVELSACPDTISGRLLNSSKNRRTDAYGGTLENRARFLLELLRAIRGASPDLPLILKLGIDTTPGGPTREETVRLARWAAAVGTAAIHVSAGDLRAQPSVDNMTPKRRDREISLLRRAARIRSETGVPLIAGGGIDNPALAEAVISAGEADFVALGRALIADSNWVHQVGARYPARRCIACNYCIDALLHDPGVIDCTVNPWAGRESELPRRSPLIGERIAVIGAGPAGLSYAACVAETNNVTIFDRAAVAGGALLLTAKSPLFKKIRARAPPLIAFIEGLERQCRAAGACFQFDCDPLRSPDGLAAFDRIVIATGAAHGTVWGLIAAAMFTSGLARQWPIAGLMSSDRERGWLYRQARRPSGPFFAPLLPESVTIETIGDARRLGGLRDAIDNAITAALNPVGLAHQSNSTAAYRLG